MTRRNKTKREREERGKKIEKESRDFILAMLADKTTYERENAKWRNRERNN